MSNDIKIAVKITLDYIPKDHILCKRCCHYEYCPADYMCDSLERCMDHEELEMDEL